MAKTSKAALILNQNSWAIRLAIRRAEESGSREPYSEATVKGFAVQVPNPSDILAWILDEIGRQEIDLGAEAQCWQDNTTKKKLVDWTDNVEQMVTNIGDCVAVAKQLVHAGVKLPDTYPWNPEGTQEPDMGEIVQEAMQELADDTVDDTVSETEAQSSLGELPYYYYLFYFSYLAS